MEVGDLIILVDSPFHEKNIFGYCNGDLGLIKQVVYSDNDELVTKDSIIELDERIKNQKGVEVIFSKIKNSNHFFKNKEKELSSEIEKYIKEKTALI